MTTSPLIVPPPLQFAINLDRLQVSTLGLSEGLISRQSDGLHLESGLEFTHGYQATDFDVPTLVNGTYVPDYTAMISAIDQVEPNVDAYTLTGAELQSFSLSAGEKLVIDYDYMPGDLYHNDYAFTMLKTPSGDLITAPLGSIRTWADTNETTHFIYTYTINTSGTYELLLGSSDVGDANDPSSLNIHSISIQVPSGSYSITSSGIQLTDGTIFRPDGSALAPGGVVTPSLFSGTTDNLVSTLQADVAAGLIGEDGSSLIGEDGSSIISQDGNGIVAQGGGNIVAQGGGNIISQDGNGIVAQGGGNVISQVGSGLIGEDGSSLLLKDAANLNTANGGGIIGSNELHVLDLDSQGLLPRQFSDLTPMAPAVGPGAEFTVSPGLTKNVNQGRQEVAALSDGKFAVVWLEGDDNAGEQDTINAVQVQLLNADGSFAGPVFSIPATSTLTQFYNSVGVVALANGGYALSYSELDYADAPPYGYTTALDVQIFDASGAAVGGPSNLGPLIPGFQTLTATSLSDGSFAIMETENPSLSETIARAVQLVTANGDAKGPAITITTGGNASLYAEGDGAIAALANGAFALAYSNGGDGVTFGLYFQVVGADGTVNAPILIEAGGVADPRMAVLTDGNIAIAWVGATGVLAQVITQDGVLVGGQIAGEYDPQTVSAPAITALSDGRFMIAYSLPNPSNPNGSDTIDAHYYNADGTPSGDYFAGATANSQAFITFPVATQLSNGTIEIVSENQPASGPDSTITAEPVVPNVPFPPGVPGTEFTIPPGLVPQHFDGNEQVVALSSGRFAVAWTDTPDGSPVNGLGVQLLNADGSAAAATISIPASTLVTLENTVGIASLPGGEFAVVYAEFDQSGVPPYGVTPHLNVQIYNGSGAPVGAPTDIGPPLSGVRTISASALSDGSFVVLQSGFTNGLKSPVIAQRVAANGTAIGASISVGSDVGGISPYTFGAVVGLANGAFAVAYTDATSGRTEGLYLQVINADGTQNTPVLIGDPLGVGQADPSMAVLTDGNIVLAWLGGTQQQPGTYFRIVTPAGVPVSSETFAQANDDSSGVGAAITALTDGRFMIANTVVDPTVSTSTAVGVQIFNADGTPSGGSIAGSSKANTYSNTFSPATTQLLNGTIEVVSVQSGVLQNGSYVNANDLVDEPIALGGELTATTSATRQGRAIDGYISGATVFADANGDGLLSPGEASATTDSLGRYSFTTPANGPIILSGGTDVSTGLPFTETLTAPAGSVTITPLTTLVQKIAATNGGNLVLAARQVNAEFGLAADTDVTSLDPLLSAAAGSSSGAAAVIGDAIVANTVSLAATAGATGDLYGMLAAQVAANPVSFDPTSVAAMQALGLTGTVATETSALAQADKAQLTQPRTWTGAIGTDLGTAGNWNPAVTPNGTQPLAFALSTGGTLTGQVSGLSATFGGPAGWLLQGAAMTLAGDQSAVGGPLAVSDAGNLTIDGGSISGGGALVVEAGSGASVTAQGSGQLTFASVSVGADAAESGSLWLSGASNLLNYGGASIGADGIGHLLVTGGATLNDGDADTLGGAVGGAGYVTVNTGGLMSDAGLIVGGSGSGEVNIGAGGTLSSGAEIDLAASPGSTGDVTVAGAAAVLSSTGTFIVGDAGLGSLASRNSGTVISNPGSNLGAADAIIANTTSANGASVAVSGVSSNWRISGLLEVGLAGSGDLDVSNGANVTANSLDAGLSLGAVANISVTGAGTELSVTGAATVADDGTGVLSVLSGATFAAASLTIGSQGDSSGAVVVSGAGSQVNLTGSLNIGTANGTGDLTVGPGAAISAQAVFQQGQVVLEGGLLDPTVQLINQGQTAGGFGTIAAGDIVDEGAIQAGGNKGSQKLLIVQGTVLGGGTLTVDGTLPGSVPAGIMQINAGGTLELSGAVLNAATTTFTDNLTPQGTYTVNNSVIDVNFVDSAGVLLLDDIAGFGGTIASYQAGNSFVVHGGTLSGLGVSNGDTLTVSDSGSLAGAGGIDQIIFGAPVSAAGFKIINGSTIQAQVPCFARGTRIETERGMVAVEDLRVADRVVTKAGSIEPIVWIGQRSVNCARHPNPKTVWPVRVSAGAFGETVPERDLFLSPDHAVFVNNVLVPVKLLINGTSIAQAKRRDVTYYHVELARHEVILAEGLKVESYLDMGDRANFGGPGEAIRLFPDFAARLSPDTALVWETRGVAPLVMAGNDLAAARTVVAANAPRCALSCPREARQ